MLLLLLSGTSSQLATGVTHLAIDAGPSHMAPAKRVVVWAHLHSTGLPLVSLVLTWNESRLEQVYAFIAAMELALDRQEQFFPHLHTLSVPRSEITSWEALLNSTASSPHCSNWRLILVLWGRRQQGLGPTSLGNGTDLKEVDEIEVFEDWHMLIGTRTKRTRVRTGLL